MQWSKDRVKLTITLFLDFYWSGPTCWRGLPDRELSVDLPYLKFSCGVTSDAHGLQIPLHELSPLDADTGVAQ